MEHTKLPWFYQEKSDVYTHIIRAGSDPNGIVCSCSQTSDGVSEADGRYIVRACNAFPAMEKVLRDVQLELNLLKDLAITDRRPKSVKGAEDRLLQVKAALAAGGEKWNTTRNG